MHNERADSAQQRLPKRWELLSAEQLCRMPVWDGFAKYLMEYISQSARSDDGFLAVGTQLDYFGAALNAAAARFKATGSDRVKIFFTCLDTKASTDEAVWLQRLRDKMVATGFKRAQESGEQVDHSVTPLYMYPEHVHKICRAFAREGSAEVSQRLPAPRACHAPEI